MTSLPERRDACQATLRASACGPGDARFAIRCAAASRRRAGSHRCRPATRSRCSAKRSISSRRFPEAGAASARRRPKRCCRVDARFEPIISHLTAQYTANYQRSSGVETRLWHGVFDLVKAFTSAYQAALKAGYAAGEQKRWKAVLPRVLVRLAHYKGLDGKFRLFRYGHWIPAQWRELHEMYEFARMRGWQREPLALDESSFAQPATFARAGIHPRASPHAPRQRQASRPIRSSGWRTRSRSGRIR